MDPNLSAFLGGLFVAVIAPRLFVDHYEIAVSLVAAWPLLQLDVGDAERLLLMAVLASAAGIVVSLLTHEDRERLESFFQRALPPGWWGPIASALGVDPAKNVRRLWLGVAAMAAAGLCVFSLLAGFGSWLCQSPAPTWWPLSRSLWIAVQLAVGGALFPVWLKLGFKKLPESLPLQPH